MSHRKSMNTCITIKLLVYHPSKFILTVASYTDIFHILQVNKIMIFLVLVAVCYVIICQVTILNLLLSYRSALGPWGAPQAERGRTFSHAPPYSSMTAIYWHWPALHIRIHKKKKEKKRKETGTPLTRAASTGNSCLVVYWALRHKPHKLKAKWRKAKEVWRVRSSFLIPTRLSWTSRISRCLIVLSVTYSAPKTPTWSKSTLFWKMYKFCWKLRGILKTPRGRTEVSLFVVRLFHCF